MGEVDKHGTGAVAESLNPEEQAKVEVAGMGFHPPVT